MSARTKCHGLKCAEFRLNETSNLHAQLDTSRILERRPGLVFRGTGTGLASFQVGHGVIVFGRFDSRRDDGTSSKTAAIFTGPTAGIVDTRRGLGIPFGGTGVLFRFRHA